MGSFFALANPDARKMWREGGEASSCPRWSPAEQRIGSGAVGGGLVAVGRDAGNLGLKQRDPLREFSLRVGGEVFARKAARCIALGPRQIAFIHHGAASQGNGLAVNPGERYARR